MSCFDAVLARFRQLAASGQPNATVDGIQTRLVAAVSHWLRYDDASLDEVILSLGSIAVVMAARTYPTKGDAQKVIGAIVEGFDELCDRGLLELLRQAAFAEDPTKGFRSQCGAEPLEVQLGTTAAQRLANIVKRGDPSPAAVALTDRLKGLAPYLCLAHGMTVDELAVSLIGFALGLVTSLYPGEEVEIAAAIAKQFNDGMAHHPQIATLRDMARQAAKGINLAGDVPVADQAKPFGRA